MKIGRSHSGGKLGWKLDWKVGWKIGWKFGLKNWVEKLGWKVGLTNWVEKLGWKIGLPSWEPIWSMIWFSMNINETLFSHKSLAFSCNFIIFLSVRYRIYSVGFLQPAQKTDPICSSNFANLINESIQKTAWQEHVYVWDRIKAYWYTYCLFALHATAGAKILFSQAPAPSVHPPFLFDVSELFQSVESLLADTGRTWRHLTLWWKWYCEWWPPVPPRILRIGVLNVCQDGIPFSNILF